MDPLPKADSEFIQEFHLLINMTARELEKWIRTPESKAAQVSLETTSGVSPLNISEKIIAILEKSRRNYSPEDMQYIRQTVCYIRELLNQKADQQEQENCRYILMNLGHDPSRRS